MSRRMIGPGLWLDEGPRTPYPGPRGMIGGPITDVKPSQKPSKRNPTPEQRKRATEINTAYVRRKRERERAAANG